MTHSFPNRRASGRPKAGGVATGGRKASKWVAANCGETPLFVYDRAIIQDRIDALRAALPAEVGIHYAVKANPMPALIEWIAPRMDGLDVASMGELKRAIDAGADAAPISFAGPGKTDAELEFAVQVGATLNLESANE